MAMWLLTSTFYGNWLPGDDRGFVGRITEHRKGDAPKPRVEHDQYGTSFDATISGLTRYARSVMKGESIHITSEQASALLEQFRETAQYRGWKLIAVAILFNHVHWLVELLEDEHGSVGLQAFKAYGSRRLNQKWGVPPSKTWWTSKGSARLKPDEESQQTAIAYVKKQHNPLLIWTADQTEVKSDEKNESDSENKSGSENESGIR
jgi:REP element-mobilizing transposase RayT